MLDPAGHRVDAEVGQLGQFGNLDLRAVYDNLFQRNGGGGQCDLPDIYDPTASLCRNGYFTDFKVQHSYPQAIPVGSISLHQGKCTFTVCIDAFDRTTIG